MRRLRWSIYIFLFSLSFGFNTAWALENPAAAQLIAADQADRADPAMRRSGQLLQDRDLARRIEIRKLLRDGKIQSSTDFYNSALVMQHGASFEDFRLAHSLAVMAAELAPDDRRAKWLVAASWDRLMMRSGLPQWYGTQFMMDKSGRWHLYSVSPTAVTDVDRVAMGLPTLEGAKAKEERLNQMTSDDAVRSN